MSGVAFVLHGHFYQPPRENPWTEVVSREPSAAPHHDWNERITAECYRPNGWARILDDQGRIVGIVDNYQHLSFNVGPTLLSWLDQHAPETYARIVAADRSARRGIAQAYGHAILPLCNDRDLRTQVRWGLADFRHRFGREAEGLWLPETAVDDRVLAVLAEEGVGFTILAPNQVSEVRPRQSGYGRFEPADDRVAEGGWREADPSGSGTPTVARWVHPTRPGLGVDLVVYDGPISHDVAFGGLASQVVVDRIARRGRELVAVACDGETFGHHHKFADRGVAHALTVEAGRRGVTVPRLADWLATYPPADEARVRLSAWSCAHGVGRWKDDCGCQTGGEPGWAQAWRAPLRRALDVVRAAAVEVFERRGPAVLCDPWAARDAYVGVLVGAVERDAFVAEWVTGDPVEALTLLECQRHALLMYTSCGWFFNDLAGLETVQILRYAARCLDLLEEVGEPAPVEAVLEELGRARSNRPEEGTGRDIWDRYVVPSRVDPGRVVAHLALTDVLGGDDPGDELAGFAVEHVVDEAVDRGGVAIVAGVMALTHRRTRRVTRWAYGAIRLGGLEVSGAVRPCADDMGDEAAAVASVAGFVEATRTGERVTELLRRVVALFGPREFGLESALPSEGGDVARRVAESLADRFVAAYEELRADHHETLAALAVAETSLPPELRGPIEAVLTRRLESEVAEVAGATDPSAYNGARAVARIARQEGVTLSSPRAARALARAVARAVDRASHDPTDEAVADAAGLVALAGELGLWVDVTVAQELAYDALRDDRLRPEDRRRLAPLAASLGVSVVPF
jgi:alpha-amylase/alpha-mannosidase (GH57 family)